MRRVPFPCGADTAMAHIPLRARRGTVLVYCLVVVARASSG